MPSLSHQAILLLFRNRPELAPELRRDALGVPLSAYSEIRVVAAEPTFGAAPRKRGTSVPRRAWNQRTMASERDCPL